MLKLQFCFLEKFVPGLVFLKTYIQCFSSCLSVSLVFCFWKNKTNIWFILLLKATFFFFNHFEKARSQQKKTTSLQNMFVHLGKLKNIFFSALVNCVKSNVVDKAHFLVKNWSTYFSINSTCMQRSKTLSGVFCQKCTKRAVFLMTSPDVQICKHKNFALLLLRYILETICCMCIIHKNGALFAGKHLTHSYFWTIFFQENLGKIYWVFLVNFMSLLKAPCWCPAPLFFSGRVKPKQFEGET